MGVFAVLLVAATALAPVLSSNGTDVSVVSADGTDALYTNGYAAEEIYGPEAYMTGLGFSSFADKLRYYAGLPFLAAVILVLIGLALLAGKSPFDPRKKFSPVTKGRSLAGKIVLIIAAVWFAAGMLFPEPMVNLILGWYL